MRDDPEWVLIPGVVPPPSTPADSTSSRTPGFASPVVLPPSRSPSVIPLHSIYSPVVPRNSTPLQQTPPITPGIVRPSPLPPWFSLPPEETAIYTPRSISSSLSSRSRSAIPLHSVYSPVVPRNSQQTPSITPGIVLPSPLPPLFSPPPEETAIYIPRSISSPALQASSRETPDPRPPSRNSSSPARVPLSMSASNPEIFIPPEVQPTPPPQSDQRHRRRPSGPLVGEGQGWAYPLDLGGTGLSYPNHSTPYNPYTPLPVALGGYTPAYGGYPPAFGGYPPYSYPSHYPPFTPRTNPANLYPPYSQYRGPQPLPLYATPTPFQVSTIHNYNTPYLPPTSQLTSYALPGNTPLPAASVSLPLPPPQPGFVSLHPDIFALGGGITPLDWDLLYPPTFEYAKLVNPPTPYAHPNFSEPAFSSPIGTVKVNLRSSSHPVLAYWMDVWGCLMVSGNPTVQRLLQEIYVYLHRQLTSSELELLLSTPENKENVVRARTIRVREGCELVLGDDVWGYKRLDVLGTHRKFAGVWVGSVSECVDEEQAGGGIEVELMVGVRPVG